MPEELTVAAVAREFRRADKEQARMRDRALVFALWMRRNGESMTATEAVAEARVVEGYLKGDT